MKTFDSIMSTKSVFFKLRFWGFGGRGSSQWVCPCSLSQEIHQTVWNQNIHYRAHNSTPFFPILSLI